MINTGSNLGSKAHELTHAAQVANGEFYILKGSDTPVQYPHVKTTSGLREVEAYKAEFSISGSVPFGANCLEDITYDAIKAAFPAIYK